MATSSPYVQPLPTLPLNTGARIPFLGFGTWQAPPGQTKAAVLQALRVGYRHIDCAFMYGNEAEVGEALKQAFDEGACKREDVFVTTKVWCTYHRRVEEGLDSSLKKLGLEWVDLYLVSGLGVSWREWTSRILCWGITNVLADMRVMQMHWPCPMNPNGKPLPFPPSGVLLALSQLFHLLFEELIHKH